MLDLVEWPENTTLPLQVRMVLAKGRWRDGTMSVSVSVSV